MITDPRSSLTETKSSLKESSFPAEMAPYKISGGKTGGRGGLIGLQSLVTARKFLLLPQANQIRVLANTISHIKYLKYFIIFLKYFQIHASCKVFT